MQEQSQLVGLETVTGCAIRFQVQFVIFDVVFHVAAGTGDLLIEYLGAGVFHIRHDKAGVNALLADLDLDDHPARA